MVQLEEVEDAELLQAQPGPIEDDEDDGDYVDTDSSLSDTSSTADFAEDESLTDRIAALKDILPPSTRRSLQQTFTQVYDVGKTGAYWGGKGLWVLSTSALLLMVPFALAVSEEQAIVEQEREMKAREGLGEGLTPGVGTGTGGVGKAL